MKKYKSAKYRLLMTIPFLAMGLGACKRHEHKNVIKESVTPDNKCFTFLLVDVETNVERIYEYIGDRTSAHVYDPDFKYLHAGDTVTVFCGGIYSDKWYQDRLVFTSADMGIRYNHDTVNMRKEREKFNITKQKMQKQK